MRRHFLEKPKSAEMHAALSRFQSGLYEHAGVQFLSILRKDPADKEALFFLRLVERRLDRKVQRPPPTLIWQFNPEGTWEGDWIRRLFGGIIGNEIVDTQWSQTAESMIVVDNRLVEAKLPYYAAAFERGCRIVLIHLSDEAFRDDTSAYPYCDAVIRNYYSELLADAARVHFFPLGYKTGFATGALHKSAPAQKYLWSFAGDPKKTTRTEMLAAMESLGGGFKHLTSDFNSADALPVSAYRALMDESIFIPCPSGWSNLDSFRVYEALEAGCIPIVEKRPNFDYFARLCGPHPLPTVSTWSEVPALIQRLQADGSVEALRQTCAEWWTSYVPALKQSLEKTVKDAMAL